MKEFKVWVEDPEISRVVQELAFNKGYDWCFTIKQLKNLESKSLYFGKQNEIRCDYSNDKDFFDECESSELTTLEAIEYLKSKDDETIPVDAKGKLKLFLLKQKTEMDEFIESMWST